MRTDLNSDDLIDFLKIIEGHAGRVFRNDEDGSFSADAVTEVYYHLRAAQEILATGEALPKSRKTALRKKGVAFPGEARISALFKQ